MKPVATTAVLAVGLLSVLAIAAPHYPEDWDGVGFVLSIARFDMSRFTPHPPGYPVYVVALKFAGFFAPNLAAATSVSVASGAASILVLRAAATRAWGARAGWLVPGAVLFTPLFSRSATVIGSEALAFLFTCIAAWGLSHRGTRIEGTAVGLAVGLGVGVRLSWAPIFVALIFLAARSSRGRALRLALLATASWALPLAAIVAPSSLLALYRAHLGGHASRWGGTFLTDPGAERALWMLRDVFVDGLGVDGDWLGVAVAAAVVALTARALFTWKKASFVAWRAAALLVSPYLLWIAVGQNLREQPRHVLPIVALFVCALGLSAARDRIALYACVALVSLMGARTLLDASLRKKVPPAGVQLALYANATEHAGTLIYAARSARFFDVVPGDARVRSAATLGDVSLSLGRENELPRVALVTSELDGLAISPYPLIERARFCRPQRLDRREPCLTLFQLKAPFLKE